MNVMAFWRRAKNWCLIIHNFMRMLDAECFTFVRKCYHDVDDSDMTNDSRYRMYPNKQ